MSRGGRFQSRGGFRGGRVGPSAYQGPPESVLEMGTFLHASEGDIVCQSINTKIPYFNAPIYLENKTAIGKVDEILGPINEVYFTIKPQDGIVATSFKTGDKFYIGPDKLLPLERFLPKPKGPPGPKAPRQKGAGRGGARGSGRGSFSRGGGRGGPMRGGPRGGSRGGFSRGSSSFGGSRGGFSGGRGGAPRGGAGGFRGGAPRGRGGFSSRGRGGRS
ncbi:Gar1-domain-containing protein [Limtongia smithiae]|uniref:Gar1-domain-containing protein n=1 Tax=Limtongia smithiae TaxID=1125753 RepID=UPI0034CE936D